MNNSHLWILVFAILMAINAYTTGRSSGLGVRNWVGPACIALMFVALVISVVTS